MIRAIYLSSLSVRRSLLRGTLSLVELPELARAHGFDGVEVSDRELDLNDRRALAHLARAAARAGGELALDLNGDLAAETAAYLARIRVALESAPALGVRVVRLTLGGQRVSLERFWRRRPMGGAIGCGRAAFLRRVLAQLWVTRLARTLRRWAPAWSRPGDPRVARAVEALRCAARWAEASGVPLAVENHWGLSTLPALLAQIVRQAGSPWLGVCLDFGNLPFYVSRRRAFHLLAPLSRHAHVSSSSPRPGPFLRRRIVAGLAALARHGYAGALAIERVAGGDEVAGARRLREMVSELLLS